MLSQSALIQGMEAIGVQWKTRFTEIHESAWYSVLSGLSDEEFIAVVERCLRQPDGTQRPTPHELLALARPAPTFRLPAAASPPATPEEIFAVVQNLRIRRHERPEAPIQHPVFGGSQPPG